MASKAVLDLVINLQDKATSGIGKLTGAIGGLGKVALFGGLGAATAAVGGLSSALIGGIGDARDAGLVFAQTEAVIKSTGGAAGFTAEQISDMAASYSLAEGKSMFGDDDIQKGQNLLLTFTNITEQLPAATGVMVDMATAMGTDVSSGAVQLGKALNDPINGISALSRVGVTFTEQQKQQIKTMQESGDMAGAQGVILAELNKEFGGSAVAAAGAAGGMAIFKERMGESIEGIGAQLLPALDQLGQLMSSPAVLGAIESMAAALGTVLGNAINWLTATGIPLLSTAFTFITTDVLPPLQAAFTVVWASIQSAVNTVYVFLSTVVWPWLQAVAFPWLTTVALPALQAAWTIAWTAIQTAVNTVWAWLQTTVWPWLQVTFFPLMMSLMQGVQSAWATAWPIIQSAVQTAWNWISTVAWPWLRDEFFPNGRDMMVELKAEWERAWPLIQAAVTTVYNFIMGTVWPWLRDVFFPKAKELMDDVKLGWEVAWAAIDTAVSTVYTWISGIAWPWFRDEFMGNLKTGIDEVKQGWEVAWPLISSAVDTVYTFFKDTVLPGIQGVLTDLEAGVNTLQLGWDTAFALMKGYVDDLKAGWDTLKSGVTTAIDTIKGAIDGLKDKLRSIKDAIPDILIPGSPTPFELGLRGIADAANTVGPALRGAFGMIGSNGMPGIEIATTLSHLMEAAKWGVFGQEGGKKLAEGVADGWRETVSVAMPTMVESIARPINETLRRIIESAGWGTLGKEGGDAFADGWRDTIEVAMPKMVGDIAAPIADTLRRIIESAGWGVLGQEGGEDLADGVIGGFVGEVERIGKAKLVSAADMIRLYLEEHGSPRIGQAGAHAAQTYAEQFRAWLELNGLGALPGLGGGTGVVSGTPGTTTGGIGGSGLPEIGTPGSKAPISAATVNNFSMTIHTSAPYEPIVADFNQLAAQSVRR